MFQDLVEAEISYSAILNNHTTLHFQEEMFRNHTNRFLEICPEMEALGDMIQVVETKGLHYYMNPLENRALCVSGSDYIIDIQKSKLF